MGVHCTFCSKSSEHVGFLVPAPSPGVYICNECAVLIVFGPAMERGGGKLQFILPNGEERAIYSFGDDFLGAEYCSHCGVYAVELSTPVGANCLNCGSLYPLRNEIN